MQQVRFADASAMYCSNVHCSGSKSEDPFSVVKNVSRQNVSSFAQKVAARSTMLTDSVGVGDPILAFCERLIRI
jgi:hypothetical protein